VLLEILKNSFKNIPARYISGVVYHDRPTECRHGILRDSIDIHVSDKRPRCIWHRGRLQEPSAAGVFNHERHEWRKRMGTARSVGVIIFEGDE
jgi:hypothetical protein